MTTTLQEKCFSALKVYTVNSTTITIQETFDYDHAGRLLTLKHSVNGAPDVIMASNTYNELGQLIAKDLHSENNGTTFKQNVDYSYNIRGWMTRINDADISTIASGDATHDLFGMKLSYNDAVSGFAATPSYNGNISAIQWSKGVATSTRQSYSYTYDVMNRLLDASHYDYAGATWAANGNQYQEALTLDLNGNIKTLQRRGAGGTLIDNLTYGYTGNQLNYVHDTGDAAKGFVNANTGTDDYSYDFNGNLDKDKNKGLAAKGDIAYNFLNLPKQLVKGSDKLLYHYDATGRKLTQQLYTGTTLTKATEYIGDLFYENDTLKFINTEEGRYMPATNEYQYHLKDHLGNVHLTFTAKPETESVTGTLEPANLISEQSKFLRYENAKLVYSNIFDKTNGVADGYSQRLSGGTNEVYGVAKSLSVMPGDTISMKVYAKYVDPTTSNWTAAFNTLMSQIATGNATVVTEGGSYSTSTSSFVNGSYLSHPTDNNAPKAYLNWLIFNRDFGFVNGGYVRMTNTAKENGQNIAHELLQSEVVITEPGYVYIYLSNESAAAGGQQVEVYFDDFGVSQIKSPIVETQDYYPFGLTFNSHRREYSATNKFLYNQGAGEKKFLTERVFDLDLNVDLSKYRTYDYVTGRWWQVDPLADKDDLMTYTTYNYSFNDPVRYNDPEGDCPPDAPCGNGSITDEEAVYAVAVDLFSVKHSAYNIGFSIFGSDTRATFVKNEEGDYETGFVETEMTISEDLEGLAWDLLNVASFGKSGGVTGFLAKTPAKNSLVNGLRQTKHIDNRHITRSKWLDKSKYLKPNQVKKLNAKTLKKPDKITPQKNGNVLYEKAMKRKIGTKGQTTNKVVVNPKKKKIVTSFPAPEPPKKIN